MSSEPPTPSPPLSPISGKPTPSSPPPTKPDPTPPPPARTPVFPSREDCWSEEATRTLIDAWGSHYLELNRGNLRQKHWQAVADAVNALHATSPKLRRTDVQCKNRIDTTKKKYKIEKSKSVQSNGRYLSTWPHFQTLDSLIGNTFSKTPTPTNHRRNLRRRISRSPDPSPETSPSSDKNEDTTTHPLMLPWPIPVAPRSKRSGPGSVTERNFSVMAAAAAAMEAQEDDDDTDDDLEMPMVGRKRKGSVMGEIGRVNGEGYRRLAEAISRLGNIYEKVEESKQQQMVELEKQRMQFVKDLEMQRMKVFMESQVQIEKLKRTNKRGSQNNSYL